MSYLGEPLPTLKKEELSPEAAEERLKTVSGLERRYFESLQKRMLDRGVDKGLLEWLFERSSSASSIMFLQQRMMERFRRSIPNIERVLYSEVEGI
jgi:hypothetical protein